MGDPYDIGIYLVTGDPEGVRVVRWPGKTWRAVAFRRKDWAVAQGRDEVARAGVYLLHGYDEADPDKPRVYVGCSSDLRKRLDNHVKDLKGKGFWDTAVAFSASDGLNGSQTEWLERQIYNQAVAAKLAIVTNDTVPSGRWQLSEYDLPSTRDALLSFMNVLPLLRITALEMAPAKETPEAPVQQELPKDLAAQDTIVVGAIDPGFEDVAMGEKRFRAFRVAEWRKPALKWMAFYRAAPISAITHVAPISAIQPYGDTGKYEFLFSSVPAPLPQSVGKGNAPPAQFGVRYTSLAKLQNAKVLSDLW